MKDACGAVIYVGKAGNLKRRVSSYFARAHDLRIERLVNEIKKIDCQKTDTALEALILESKLIKRLNPKFNVKEKDDKSFLYVAITKEKFPRVLLARGSRVKSQGSRIDDWYGPFTSAGSIREALKILRRIFPWSNHIVTRDMRQATRDATKPCFDYEIGLCPGTCIGAISSKDYLKNINRLKLFFAGKKLRVLGSLQKEMKAASKRLEFEKAEKLRRQIFALQHIRDTALINEEPFPHTTYYLPHTFRIEGYDISNISGASAVGAMVVFRGDHPRKDEYRKFKIKTIHGSHDVGMLREVLGRRFGNWKLEIGNSKRWPLPDLILVDGGIPQVNAARSVLREYGLAIPIVGIAKGPTRKRNDVIGIIPAGISRKTLIRVRDEAHRFAIGYHKKLRGREFIPRTNERSL